MAEPRRQVSPALLLSRFVKDGRLVTIPVAHAKRLVVLDIGSGFNTPMWIRWPSEKLVRSHERARLIRINLHHPEVPSELAERSVSFRAGADTIIDALLRNAAATPLLRKEGGAASVSR